MADPRESPDRRDLVLSPPPERRSVRRRAADWPQEWITISAFAQKYGVSRHTVYKWMACDLLDTFTVETVTRIRDLPPPHK